MLTKALLLRVYGENECLLIERQFTALPIRIGRSSLNDLEIPHKLASEFHARIEEADGKICVRDLSSKNGVFARTPTSSEPVRIPPQSPWGLDQSGLEFLLSPALRIQLLPSDDGDPQAQRLSHARGSVLGNPSLPHFPSDAIAAPDAFTASFVSSPPVAVPAPAGAPRSSPPVVAVAPSPPVASQPPAPTPVPRSAPSVAVPPVVPQPPAPAAIASNRAAEHEPSLRLPALSIRSVGGSAPSSSPPIPLPSLPSLPSLSPRPPSPPRTIELTAWDPAIGSLPLPAQAPLRSQASPGSEPPKASSLSLEALALRGLRELAASLVPGRSLESASDVAALITKLHDALEIFCRCFIPVREGSSRFVPTADLESTARERCRARSSAYIAVERAREPHAIAAALLDWRNPAQDAPAAVENIFADLVLQQVMLEEGALRGVRALLRELSPDRIEQSADGSGRIGTLFSGRHRALWEHYAARHQELEDANEALTDLFGAEFARAYQRYWNRESIRDGTR
jgi:hypothetical protein